eukprot:9716005-Alexandrium_andersonii.AAC.1
MGWPTRRAWRSTSPGSSSTTKAGRRWSRSGAMALTTTRSWRAATAPGPQRATPGPSPAL